MNETDSSKFKQSVALFRYDLIIPVLNGTFPDTSALAYFKRITDKPFHYVDGSQRVIAYQTVRYWYDRYRKGGFDALIPKDRFDSGNQRKLSSEAKEKILQLKTSNVRLTATNIYHQLIEDGTIYQRDVSLSTVTRFIKLNRDKLNLRNIEDMRAFEMEHINDLWQIDTSYCSFLTLGKNKVRTYLVMIIDDASRMIVGFNFYLEDNGVNVQRTLRMAIQKFGLPSRIYTDHGKPYRNEQLSLICAQLQIELNRAQIYHGNQKGKIERAFRSVKEQWMFQTDFNQFSSCEDIEKSLAVYINKKNNSSHDSLNQLTPFQRFLSEESRIRRIDAQQLEKIFYHTANRRVNNDATIKLNSEIYETFQQYIGQQVQIKYMPDLSHVYLYINDEYIEIKKVNKVENSRIKRNEPLFAKEE